MKACAPWCGFELQVTSHLQLLKPVARPYQPVATPMVVVCLASILCRPNPSFESAHREKNRLYKEPCSPSYFYPPSLSNLTSIYHHQQPVSFYLLLPVPAVFTLKFRPQQSTIIQHSTTSITLQFERFQPQFQPPESLLLELSHK